MHSIVFSLNVELKKTQIKDQGFKTKQVEKTWFIYNYCP